VLVPDIGHVLRPRVALVAAVAAALARAAAALARREVVLVGEDAGAVRAL
jgi:hypothetical protein